MCDVRNWPVPKVTSLRTKSSWTLSTKPKHPASPLVTVWQNQSAYRLHLMQSATVTCPWQPVAAAFTLSSATWQKLTTCTASVLLLSCASFNALFILNMSVNTFRGGGFASDFFTNLRPWQRNVIIKKAMIQMIVCDEHPLKILSSVLL